MQTYSERQRYVRMTVLTSTRSAMTKDETIFPDAEEFVPERFLNTSDRKMINFTLPFGFGRRQCPGTYVAWQSIFISVVR